MSESICPGCGLNLPRREGAAGHRYYNASPECWLVYTELLAAEYADAVLFGQIHQMTVDAYAVQHAGGRHPDKSIDVHLVGLHLVLVEGIQPTAVPPLLQRLVSTVETWPHFSPPPQIGGLTVADVAMSDHMETVRRWARLVWESWSEHHSAIAYLVMQLQH